MNGGRIPPQGSGMGPARTTLWWWCRGGRAVLASLLLVLAVSAGAATPVAADPAGGQKYYVVAEPPGGQREYLFAIAVKTLGNGNRYHEIVELNRGRRQPDGAVFTDAMEVRPGWILVLPADASGPGVRTGTPTQTVQPGTRAADQTGLAVRSAETSSSDIDTMLIRIGAVALAVLLLLLALRVMYGGQHRPARVAVGHGSRTRPGYAGLPLAIPASAGPGSVEPTAATRVRTRLTELLPVLVRGTAVTEPTRAGAAPAGPEPAPAAEPATPATEPATQPVTEPAAEAGPIVGPAERPPLPGDDRPPALRETLVTPDGALHVRLIGAAVRSGTSPFAWLADGETAPPALLPLVLGHRGPWRLHIDLSRVPDVLTVVGTEPDCRRHAAKFARQLAGAGIEVAFVGDALGDAPLLGATRLDRFPEPPGRVGTPLGTGPRPTVVVAAGPLGDAAAAVRSLAAATAGRVVPIIIGEVPAGRWSVQVPAGGDGLSTKTAVSEPAADPGRCRQPDGEASHTCSMLTRS